MLANRPGSGWGGRIWRGNSFRVGGNRLCSLFPFGKVFQLLPVWLLSRRGGQATIDPSGPGLVG